MYYGMTEISGQINTVWNGTKFIQGNMSPADPFGKFPSYGTIQTSQYMSDFNYGMAGVSPFISGGNNTGGCTVNIATTAKRHGFVRLETSTNAGGSGYIATPNIFYLGSYSKTATTTPGIGVRFRADAAVGVTSSATDRFVYRIGFSNASQTVLDDGTNGIFFKYTDTLNSGNIQIVAISSSVSSVINTSIAGTAAVYKVFEFELDDESTTASFYINGAFQGYITTSLPTSYTQAVGAIMCISKSAGTTNRVMTVDTLTIRCQRANPI